MIGSPVADLSVVNSLELVMPEGEVTVEAGVSRSFFPEGVWESFRDGEQFPDISGPDLSFVLPHVGWCGTGQLVVARCWFDDEVVASGWAMGIRWGPKKGHEQGVNLSYAVVPGARGRGLASLATAAALLTFYDHYPSMGQAPVNAQASTLNTPSITVAQKLGLQPEPMADFYVARLDRHYVGSGGPAEAVIARCQSILLHAADESSRRACPHRAVSSC